MKLGRQTTLRERISLTGFGVHSNAPVRMVIHPAEADSGVVFSRTGPEGEQLIKARWTEVANTELCTVLGREATVSTVEHLLAAFSGLGLDNAMVEIDGPEVPIMDGSARQFVDAVDQAGLIELSAPRRYIKVLKPVRVEQGRAFSELRPAERGLRLDVEIDFAGEVIGRQKIGVDLSATAFRRDLAGARTFGFLRDVERLWKAGFALGASLDNTVAVDEQRVINPGGLRFENEFVRHKTLDAVGDLALGGAPLIGAYRSFCGGHKTNVAVLEALFADRSAYEIIEAPRVRQASRSALKAAALPAYSAEIN
ncbi:MAG TPA: UDP-3-O-acyl-N-acetylglucosamine deacetylase [Beijerinckiaceae bacterium]|nr:UDP-3-O-acyl-N-acetylglucosamine deacetylase [Beijerinckiaceae bacterium]